MAGALEHPHHSADRERGGEPAPVVAGRAGAVTAAVAGLAAGWIAAGSTGLVAHPLGRALTCVALGVAAVAAWPSGERAWARRAVLLGGVVAALATAAPGLPPVNVMGVVLFLAFVSWTREGAERTTVVLAAMAVAALGIYRAAVTSVPLLWHAANAFGRAMGWAAAALGGGRLRVGATFGGVDCLVAMAALYVGWLGVTRPVRGPRGVWVAVAILGGHLGYLFAVSAAPAMLATLPASSAESGGWWAEAARVSVPWNLPALACAIHLTIAGAMLWWSAQPGDQATASTRPTPGRRWERYASWLLVCSLAAGFPVLTTLCRGKAGLRGKKIVVYQKGYLNWQRPAHGQYGQRSCGMYGMLPVHIESLGARCVVSPHLSGGDLADAAVVVLLYPDEPWEEGQLERVWAFVQRGGSLAVFGEHTVREADGGSRFNDVLAPTSMRVRFDSAMFAVGGWLHSYQTLAHPATMGVRDDQNQFGVVIGASVEAGWRTRAVLVGRFGWADAGDAGSSAAMMGNGRYDGGEQLGDLVLAAEESFGAGKVVAFGDTSSMANGILGGSHVFTSRLLAYLAGGALGPQAPWRQVVGTLAGLALAVVLVARPRAWQCAVAAAALAGGLCLCARAGVRSAEALPDGRNRSPNCLAYIDTTHLEASSGESWRPDGRAGLALTLMRNGYLTLDLPELTAERLRRAGLLVSIAPSRVFSPRERKVVRGFVERGGVFICTVGCDEAGPSRRLLADFGFRVGGAQVKRGMGAGAPQPLGHFKSPYVSTGEYMAHVRFHAAWPVECTAADAQIVARGPGDTAVIVARRVGRGTVVVVGDTCFAMNKNLEHADGTPFEGMRENAHFWRWLLTVLRDEPPWMPPVPHDEIAPAETIESFLGIEEPGDGPESEVEP